jgi:hypothetical protein
MKTVSHKFVEFIPDVVENGVVYISITYATAVHKCCCGCQEEVVTPLSPMGWELTFDGKSISLSPSIGNWSFKCRSHYWIVRNKVKWMEQWSTEKIDSRRKADEKRRDKYYDKRG